MSDGITAQERCDIEALIYEHAWLLDHHRSETLADLYVEEGRLTGIGMNHVGREALQKYGSNRAKMTGRIARHLYNNLRLTRLDNDRIQGNVTITLYRHDGPNGLPEPNAVADATDIYIKCDDGRWRFVERNLQLVFESEAHKAGAAHQK